MAVEMESELSAERRVRCEAYWRRNLGWLGGLLAVWFLVSYGCGILWVDWLDQWEVPGLRVPLGFWFAQQGSIYVFVVLIAVYVVVMNRLDGALREELRVLGEGGEREAVGEE